MVVLLPGGIATEECIEVDRLEFFEVLFVVFRSTPLCSNFVSEQTVGDF